MVGGGGGGEVKCKLVQLGCRDRRCCRRCPATDRQRKRRRMKVTSARTNNGQWRTRLQTEVVYVSNRVGQGWAERQW
jgi:hypothetical protein